VARRSINFADDSVDVARQLIGVTLLVNGVGGVIVETEAYDEIEPASHSFRGLTRGNAVLFGPPGRVYVYLSYGVHWCLNIVCREAGHGAGVLIRALEPTTGVPEMIRRRHQRDAGTLCAGPGRLAQALAITGAMNGMRIDSKPFQLLVPALAPKVVRGTRIGITKAMERRWRFGLSASAFHSRPFRSSVRQRRMPAPGKCRSP
jgi:DNA-3-methyladenine glycosylase